MRRRAEPVTAEHVFEEIVGVVMPFPFLFVERPFAFQNALDPAATKVSRRRFWRISPCLVFVHQSPLPRKRKFRFAALTQRFGRGFGNLGMTAR